MKIEKITNPYCFRDFARGATIKTESGREAENIIRTYFQTEIIPEAVHVYYGGEIGQIGTWGYTFRVAE